MIDTIRFKIPLDVSIYLKVKESGIPSMKKTDRNGYSQDSLSDQIYVSDLLGSMRLYVLSKNLDKNLYLEFSVPKVYYGHNLFLFYPDGLPEVCFKVMDGLNQRFGITLPNFSEWIIQRLDLCTVWKLPSDEIALAFLQSLRDFEYPRKHVAAFDTSLMYKGSSGNIKFYLKHPEFLAHDFKGKFLVNEAMAEKLAEYAIGCLRFEAELRKSKLKTIFHLGKGEFLRVDDILSEGVLQKILADELKTWIKTIDPVLMTDFQIMEKLKAVYDTKKSLELFSFYVLYTDSQMTKTILKQNTDKSTINRKLQLLAKAGVGLRGTLALPFELTVPSSLNPNQNNQDIPDLSTTEPLPEKQLNLPLSRPSME